MKKSILLFAMILVGLCTFAQNTYNLVLFSEDGEKFYVFANGIRQNDVHESNVKITGLTSEFLNVRVEFENKALPVLKQNMPLEYGYEHTVNLKKNMKKVMKMQYFGKVALADAPKSNGSTVQYHTSENAATDNTTGYNTSTSSGGGDNNSSTTVTHQTTTHSNTNGDGGAVSINMGGVGISMNVNDNMGGINSTTSSTVTTTTYSSSSSSSGVTHIEPENHGRPKNSNTTPQQPVSNGCGAPMNSSSYEKMKQSVESKPFSDTKMSTAKIATKNSCLSSAQIAGICKLFAMDDDKLAYAKYAYDYCVDKTEFYHVSEVFSFSSTTDELNKYLESK
ncbi:MAG: hypothetical protein K0S32_1881 [Bacteroidetes bacterium]|jgi:hypothetical protein|nr:hypothetical protein [Bacteroidota bacterium]